MDYRAINQIIRAAYNAAQTTYKRIWAGEPILAQCLCEQKIEVDKLTARMYVKCYNDDTCMWEYYLQIEVRGMQITVDFPCDITLNKLRIKILDALSYKRKLLLEQVEIVAALFDNIENIIPEN